MDLRWDVHFREIIIPNWQEYREAETKLTSAHDSNVSGNIEKARLFALRKGETAAISLHHFAEKVLHDTPRPPWLPADRNTEAKIRAWLSQYCTALRGPVLIDDVALLNDVADALKHSKLRNKARAVSSSDAVLAAGTLWGRSGWGEGK